MTAKIIQHSKLANSGAPLKKADWFIEFETHPGSIYNDKVTGWQSSNDMSSELKLKFSSKEAAEEFARSNNIEYEVVEPNHKRLVKRTYAENFK